MGIRPDLGLTATQLVHPVVTRYAPSPTGYLHLGHVVNAIYVWGLARALGGRVLLRLEDHDRSRCRPEYVTAILDDLAWLGFAPDGGVPLLRQSGREAAYSAALHALQRTQHVYACRCSRARIGGERYPGTCRYEGLDPAPGRGVRVVLGPGVERFQDLLLGPQVQSPDDQCGDLLLRDRDGYWTYQFAATVDDRDQGVTLVVRGEDLLPSTGRQIRLARMLGRPAPPAFLHHPLVLKPSGEKLSKAQGDTGVRELRRAGLTPPDVIGRAAAAVGLATPRPLDASRVHELFTAPA